MHQINEGCQPFPGRQRPGWIRRRPEQEASGPFGPGLLKCLWRHLEALSRRHVDAGGHRVDQTHEHLIAGVPGIRHEQFIAGIQQQTRQEQKAAAGAGSHHDSIRIDAHAC